VTETGIVALKLPSLFGATKKDNNFVGNYTFSLYNVWKIPWKTSTTKSTMSLKAVSQQSHVPSEPEWEKTIW